MSAIMKVKIRGKRRLQERWKSAAQKQRGAIFLPLILADEPLTIRNIPTSGCPHLITCGNRLFGLVYGILRIKQLTKIDQT